MRVTDHAVVRYLEKIVGVDIDAIRWKIAHDELPDGAHVVERSHRVIVKSGRVVTVLTLGEKVRRKPRHNGKSWDKRR